MPKPELVPKEYTLFYPVRPFTLNTERRWHWRTRAKHVKQWRGAFLELATAAGMTYMGHITVEATPVLGDRKRQDVAACFPAVKAAIDGVTDAGVIIDDTPDYLLTLTFHAPRYEKGVNGLELTIKPARQ